MNTKMKTLQLIMLLIITTTTFSQNTYQKIDSLLKATHSKNSNISISLGFVNNNAEFYTSYGNLDRKSTVKVDKNSLFEIASITKILTSNLIAKAQLENKLNSNDFIDDYLPKAYQLNKNLKQKIKISDLASHQSGLPDIDFRKLIEANPQQPISGVNQNTLTNLVNSCTELIDYGNYRYSTIGYILLGQILETVYNKNYIEIINEKLIIPLKMTSTFTTDFNAENKTQGYNSNGGIQEFFNWNVMGPAGLVKSTALDMIIYLKAVLNEKSSVGLSALFCEKIQYNKDGREIGLGLNILKDAKNTIYAKTGDSMGQSSIIAYDRKNNWGIIILLNERNHKLRQELFNNIFEIIKTK